MGSTGKKIAKAAVAPIVKPTEELIRAGKKIKDGPKMSDMPKTPATASALTTEDDNVRSASEAERKRLYSGGGRAGASILEGDYSNEKKKSDLLGG